MHVVGKTCDDIQISHKYSEEFRIEDNVRPGTDRDVLMGSVGIIYPTLSLSWVLNWFGRFNTNPAALTPRKRHVTDLQEALWVPGPFRTGAEYLTLIGIRSPDCPARSESQYRLSYRGSQSNEFIE